MFQKRNFARLSLKMILITAILGITSFVFGDILTVHFIDVGQGDSIFVQAPDGQTMLIDAGLSNGKAENYLKSLGVEIVDIIVATHLHADHVGGLPGIIENFNVGQIVTPQADSIKPTTYKRLSKSIEDHGLQETKWKAGAALDLGDVTVECLAPNSELYKNINDSSIVLKLTYGEVSFLLTGDASKDSEKEMVDIHQDSLDSNILKIGHHGSSSSSTAAFMEAVNPQIVVFLLGDNTYDHPHEEVWDRVSGLAVFRTDLQDTIIFTTDGETINSYSTSENGQYVELASYRGARRLDFVTAPPAVTQPFARNTVYMTKAAKTYHRCGCRNLNRLSILLNRIQSIGCSRVCR